MWQGLEGVDSFNPGCQTKTSMNLKAAAATNWAQLDFVCSQAPQKLWDSSRNPFGGNLFLCTKGLEIQIRIPTKNLTGCCHHVANTPLRISKSHSIQNVVPFIMVLPQLAARFKIWLCVICQKWIAQWTTWVFQIMVPQPIWTSFFKVSFRKCRLLKWTRWGKHWGTAPGIKFWVSCPYYLDGGT